MRYIYNHSLAAPSSDCSRRSYLRSNKALKLKPLVQMIVIFNINSLKALNEIIIVLKNNSVRAAALVQFVINSCKI